MASKFELYFDRKPPAESGTYAVQSVATGAAANLLVTTALSTDAPKGPVWLALEAVTYDVHVRFKATATSAATTASNGLLIKAGEPAVMFGVDLVQLPYIDHYSPGGAGVLKVQVASQPYARSTF